MTLGFLPKNKREHSVSNFLIYTYLKDPIIKLEYKFISTAVKDYPISFFPLTQDKEISLNPKSVIHNIKIKLTGEWQKGIYKNSGITYAGKGCVFDHSIVSNGSFCCDFVNGGYENQEISVNSICNDWKFYIKKIIDLCIENNCEVIFYSAPSSDFYLAMKKNYDSYIDYIKNFLAELNVSYFDFNLCKKEFLSLEDSDFSDTNHLNESGIKKFTKCFLSVFSSENNIRDSVFFHNSFSEKINLQNSKILGLVFTRNKDDAFFNIVPIINHGNIDLVEYDVFIDSEDGNGFQEVAIKSKNSLYEVRNGTKEKIKVVAYYNGTKNCNVEKLIVFNL